MTSNLTLEAITRIKIMFSKDYQYKALSYVVVLTLLRNVIRCTMAFTIVSDSEGNYKSAFAIIV